MQYLCLATPSVRVVVALAALAGCAAANDELGGGLSASGATSTVTSASSGGATESSTGSTEASTGASSSTGGVGGGGGSGQGGSGTGAGGQANGGSGGAGGGSSGTLIAVATSSATVLAARFDASTNAWATTSLADASTEPPSLAVMTGGIGVALLRSTANSGELRYALWSSAGWSSFAAVAPFVTTRARPSVVATDSALVAFQGDDFKYYFAGYQGAWAPTAEPVGGATQQSFGPSPASIATLGGDAVIAFAGDDGDLYDQTRTGGAWQPAHAHGLVTTSTHVVDVTPAIAAPSQGPDLVIVYVRKSDAKLHWTTRSAGVWTVPVAIDGAFSAGPPALTATPSGGAVLAFRGLDAQLYAARYDGGAVAPWSTPAAIATPNVTTPSTPSLAPGIGVFAAELAFVDGATGAAYHARLANTSWTPPSPIGGSALSGVAIASAP